MSRRRIYLLRHGDVSYVTDTGERPPPDSVPLNERGRAQASAAGEALREVPFDLVVTSALRRTLETAELVLAGREVPRRVVPGLNEIAPGDLGKLGDPTRTRDTVVNAFVEADVPGATFLVGERFDDFHRRVSDAIASVLADTGWSTLLLVAHGGVNRAILTEATGAGLSGYGSIEQDPACINVLDVDAWERDSRRAFVRLQNYTPYDPAKLLTRRTTMESLWSKFSGGSP